MEDLLLNIGESIISRDYIERFKALATPIHRPRLVAHLDLSPQYPEQDLHLKEFADEVLARVRHHDDFPKLMQMSKRLSVSCPNFRFRYRIVFDTKKSDDVMTTALVRAKRKPVPQLSANDRRFLRSMRITQDIGGEDEHEVE